MTSPESIRGANANSWLARSSVRKAVPESFSVFRTNGALAWAAFELRGLWPPRPATRRARRVMRLRLDPRHVAFLGALPPERPPDRRHPVVVVDGDERVEREMALVHALDDDEFLI